MIRALPDLLSSFLSDLASRPWSWGECDCLMVLADWVKLRTGRDPAEGWRGRYRTARGAYRVALREGGLVEHVDRCMMSIARARTDAPQRGDIAIVQVTFGLMGAICIHPQLWAIKSMDGLAAAKFPVVRAWSVVD